MRRRIGGVLFGLLAVLVGLGSIFLFSRTSTLACTRLEPNHISCIHRTRLVGLIEIGQRTIDDLQGARIAESCDEDGCTFRVNLVCGQGEIVGLTSYYSSGYRSKQETVDRIQAFVESAREERLEIEEGDTIFPFCFGGLFVVVGVFVAVKALVSGL